MPEPNLPPLHIAIGPIVQGCVNAENLRQQMPELPQETRNKLRSMELTPEQILILSVS